MLKKLHVKFQVIPTSFGLVSTLDKKSAKPRNKVFGFPKNGKLCAPICVASNRVFFKRIRPINEGKCQQKYRRKKNEKRAKNGEETATEPKSRRKPTFSGPFRVSS